MGSRRINFIVNPVFINNGWSPWDKRIGGTEECVVQCAIRLKRRGHNVSVFHNGQHGDYEGVPFRERSEYLEAAGPGFTINVNYPDLKPLEPTIYWTSLDRNAGWDLSAFRAVCVISNYARRHTGVSHPNIHILPPGYDAEKVKPAAKIPQTVLYASSPDRGLDNLIRVWPDVVQAHPQAQLIVTYGAHLGNLPNAICLGEVTDDEMNELYATSDIWCHPASGGELYCMTGIKAQASGCVPVYFPIMALAETVKQGVKCTPEDLQYKLIGILGDERAKAVYRARLAKETFPTWESTTDQWEELIAKYA